MSKYKPRNPAQPPEVNPVEPPPEIPEFYKRIFKIEPVTITVVFDRPKPNDVVVLENPSSADLFRLLAEANLKRGSVTQLWIREEKITGAPLARLNWFLHIPGYSKGFRAWKIANQNRQGGSVFWKSSHAWDALKETLNI